MYDRGLLQQHHFSKWHTKLEVPRKERTLKWNVFWFRPTLCLWVHFTDFTRSLSRSRTCHIRGSCSVEDRGSWGPKFLSITFLRKVDCDVSISTRSTSVLSTGVPPCKCRSLSFASAEGMGGGREKKIQTPRSVFFERSEKKPKCLPRRRNFQNSTMYVESI